MLTMEKAVDYEVQYKKEGDNLELISGTLASPPDRNWSPNRIDRKEAQRTSCMQQCCMISFAVVSVVALCASVAAIILVLAFPNVANPAVQEILVLKDQLTAQLASTSAPSTGNSNDELIRIRETLERLATAQESGTCEVPPLGSATYPARSCRDISADLPSGDYWIQTNDTSCPIRVYCDLNGSPCSCKCDAQQGGWMRVANFNMADPNQNCPEGFILVNSTDPPLRLCGRPGPVGCTSVVFPVNGIEYSRVCGKVKAYIHASPDGFFQVIGQNLEGHYVDGISITYGSPRNHIWTFAASWTSTDQGHGCPCDTISYQGTVPSFINNDYFCEGGHSPDLSFTLNTDIILWDGMNCLNTSTCCRFNNPPYFCQTLDAPTTNDIEVRLCGNQNIRDEDTPFEAIDIFVY